MRSGFSFIEVLFAIFLVGLAASIVTATLPIANTSRARADMQNKAVGLAQKELEAVKGLGYANATAAQLYAYGLIDSTTPVAGTTYSFTNVDTAVLDNPSRLLPGCTATLTVTQPQIDLRQVTVTVTWNERGKTRTFTTGTLIANL
jgi:prepilin-type N-terminal cleavage/methylation domain-containing protein